jgi:hypothetical protein
VVAAAAAALRPNPIWLNTLACELLLHKKPTPCANPRASKKPCCNCIITLPGGGRLSLSQWSAWTPSLMIGSGARLPARSGPSPRLCFANTIGLQGNCSNVSSARRIHARQRSLDCEPLYVKIHPHSGGFRLTKQCGRGKT